MKKKKRVSPNKPKSGKIIRRNYRPKSHEHPPVIGAIESRHVEALHELAQKEPIVIVAAPKSLWEEFKDWIRKE